MKLERFTSPLVAALFGLGCGYFVWHVGIEPPRRIYPVTWTAPWITHPISGASETYYRKRLFLPAAVRHASVQVMAHDTQQVYVNGRALEPAKRMSATVTAVYDLTGLLRPGTNILAVSSNRQSFPGDSEVVVEGSWLDWQGQSHGIATDATWRVSTIPERVAGGGLRWLQPDFDDADWAIPVVKAVPDGLAEDSKVNFPPQLLDSPSPASWAWGPTSSDRQAFVRCGFRPDPSTREAWVEVSAMDAYALFVNGVLVGHTDQWVGVRGLPEMRERSVDIYNATRFLRPGRNVVAVSALGDPTSRRMLASVTLVDQDNSVRRISTPEGCRVGTNADPGWTTPGYDDSSWTDLHPVGSGSTPDEILTRRRLARPNLSDTYEARMQGVRALIHLGGAGLATLCWWGAGLLTARRQGIARSSALDAQRMPFLWGNLFLGLALLVSFDIRFGNPVAFRWETVQAAVAIVALLCLLRVFDPVGPQAADDERAGLDPSALETASDQAAGEPRPRRATRLALAAFLIGLTAFAFVVRFQLSGQTPLTGDEVTMAVVSSAIWEKGYPVGLIAADLPPKYFTTSEIVPYPLAVGIKLFGLNETGVRFAGVLFAALTVPLIALVGQRMFDLRTGLLAATLFAWLPFAIKMANYARYPSQLAFFTLLTVFLLDRALEQGLKPWPVALTAISCSLMYLSWEGAAFVMPALLVGLILARREDVGWLRSGPLWLGLGGFGIVVFLELSLRLHLNADWPRLGIGISQLTPALLLDQPLYDPWSYVSKLFLLENLQTTSLLALAGLLFAWSERRLAYLAGTVVTTVLLMTNLLETQDSRHVYHLLALLLLVSARSFWRLCDVLVESMGSLTVRSLGRAGLLALFLLSANTQVFRLYGMPGNHAVDDARLGVDRPDGVKVAFPRASWSSPLDRPVISYQPHVAWFYVGRADQYIQTRLQIPVAVASTMPQPVHRLTGSPLVYSMEDLKSALAQDPWSVVITPQKGSKLLSREVRAFLAEQMQVVYEDSRLRVYSLSFAARSAMP